MNCKQANDNIHMTDLMERLGYAVKNKERGGSEWRYLSPFRSEAEPSFYVNVRDNCWFDHGEAEGSRSVVDFAIKYLQTNGKQSRVSDALAFLEDMGFGGISTRPLFPTERPFEQIKEELPRDLEFIRAKPVQHPAIPQYLQGRGIPEHLVRKYLEEVQYRNIKKDKVFFAFGIKNRAGGYEIRSASDKPVFKSALIQRDITIIKGNETTRSVNVFEGMVDFLSLLVLHNGNRLQGDTIIMHSLSSFWETLQYIRDGAFQNVNLWLDNDKSGKKMVGKFKEEGLSNITDQSHSYEGFNDLNDLLKYRIGQTKKPDQKMSLRLQ